MSNIFSKLGESKIFKNEEILSQEYLPDILPHREQQIKLLADNLSPASGGRKPQNTFIYGSPGVGKTASVKYVFREFEEYSERVKTIYLNCWDYKTAHALFSEIVIKLGFLIQRRGWAKDEIIKRLIEVLDKINKSLVVCLDEVDQLEEEALYDLLRINQYVKTPVGVVFISNNPHVFVNVEPRIRSSLNIEEIEFKPYSIDEMKNILQERVKYAFTSVENGVVILAANHAVQKGGDVRVGLECLMKAGRIAEQDNDNKVRVEHVKKILKDVREVKPEIIKERLDDSERDILDVIEKKKYYSSGELYDIYCKKVKEPMSERKFRECINRLEKLGFIEIHEKTGIHGKSRSICLI